MKRRKRFIFQKNLVHLFSLFLFFTTTETTTTTLSFLSLSLCYILHNICLLWCIITDDELLFVKKKVFYTYIRKRERDGGL